MTDALFKLPAHALQKLLFQKKISCRELTTAFIERIEAIDPELNAFLYIDREGGLPFADVVDRKLAAGETQDPLLGIPMVLPDVLNMKGTPTTFGSLIFKKNISQEDIHEVNRIKKAGSVILGKTNMAEFGLSYETVNRIKAPCHNPWNLEYTPGGGSGGASVAVAAGLAPLALGTDFNGAMRMSSSFCGVPSLMPTRGRVPIVRKHLLPESERLFYRKGIIARNSHDMAMTLNVLAEPDIRDPQCSCDVHKDFIKCLGEHPHPLKIAYSRDLGFLPVAQDVLAAVDKGADQLRAMGHSVSEIDLQLEPDILSHFLNLFTADRYVLIMRGLEERPDAYDLISDNVKEWLKLGNEVTGAQYSLAVLYIGMLEDKIDKLMETFDLLLTPAVPVSPFPLGSPPETIAGFPCKPHVGLWAFLIPFNMSGHPALTLPCGLNQKGLPISMQCVGRKFSEGQLLALAHAYESAHPFPECVRYLDK